MFHDVNTCESPVLSCLEIQWILMWQEHPVDVSRKVIDEQIVGNRSSRLLVLFPWKEQGLILAHSSKSHSPEWQQGQEVAGRMISAVRKQRAAKASAQLLFLFSPGSQPSSCRSFHLTWVLLPWRLSIIYLTIDIDDHNDIWLIHDKWRRARWQVTRWMNRWTNGQADRFYNI